VTLGEQQNCEAAGTLPVGGDEDPVVQAAQRDSRDRSLVR
jgi:hypothetical protein